MNFFPLAIIKISVMIIMFLMILITGLIPLRMQSFNQNQKVMSLASGFSGGLFLSVALIHLLPESQQKFRDYFIENNQTEYSSIPFAQILIILSFLVFLFIEKIAFTDIYERHSLSYSPKEIPIPKGHKVNQLTPYILQLAIGVHAVFEGIAIGIEGDFSDCFGIAAAVVCHKWEQAEGLTLGLAFVKSGVDLKQAQVMILLQALMNPIGVGLGWLLSDQGLFITSVFTSLSAGTFLYISTIEVIVEEFSIPRFQIKKSIMFIGGVIFISFIWLFEKILE